MATHDELLAPMAHIGAGFDPDCDQAGRDAAWEAAMTEDVVWEAPFTDPPVKISGRRAVGKFFDWLLYNVPVFAMDTEAIYFVDDGNSYVVQVAGGGPTRTGDVYRQNYFSLIVVRDGKICHFREHFKTAEAYRAFGREYFHDSINEIMAEAAS